ncbi:hypothetical protein JGH11_13800 [Dysgonomonas sp. Marseille-P4677]|uniref:hypothetical protein n=1 Tax=Dysgonomonas sp. Marseille-P4677 TaxID=2364790 RepID=UPI001914922E|nr:hypothetical protein [Dysgonomonas sp. Marseille-P4677]MBK5721949.1 hypothetical protein [Dysgonomonas sp. Marseille-P4677]
MKYIISILLSLFTAALFAQSDKEKQAIPAFAYDSTANFLGINAMGYTGQELFLKGLDKSSQSYGYSGFILKYKKDNDLLNDEKNIYKPNDNYNSRYDDLAHKYFHVLEVIKHPSQTDSNGNTNEFYLKLQELSSGDIMYYKYDINSEYTFPFITRGFFEKQKQLLSGKEFVISDDILKTSRNLVTRKAIAFTTGEIWKCIDVDIDNTNNELSLVLQSKQGVKMAIPYSLLNEEGLKKVYTATEAATLTKKYNINNFRRILQNKVRVGMTKDMTRMAWGEPTEIKETGKTEQWIYPAGQLTFSGDKIISTK